MYSFDTSTPVIFGTIENLPPFSYYENDELVGIDIDMANELAARCHFPLKIMTLPWARVLAELKTGEIDGAFSLYFVQEREFYCQYVGIIHYDNLGLITKKGHEFAYHSVKDLKGKTIGKGLGVFVSQDFDTAVKNKDIAVEEIDDTGMGNIKKLYVDRLDAVIGVIETMRFYAHSLGYGDDFTEVKELIDSKRPGFLVLSKKSILSGDGELQDEMQKALRDIFLDGTYSAIVAKYEGYPPVKN
jgi:polar amino acid transport system substrate-binding protein